MMVFWWCVYMLLLDICWQHQQNKTVEVGWGVRERNNIQQELYDPE